MEAAAFLREGSASDSAISCVGSTGVPLSTPSSRIGARLSPAQIRLRIADISRVNPDAVMPAFHRTEGLNRVASAYAGKPALTGQQVEDIVAWLGTLR